MKRTALLCLAFALLSVSAAAFDMSSINYRVSGDVNSGSGNSSSASYRISQLAVGTISNQSQSGSYKIILGVSMPEINDTFAATCVSNSTSCVSQQYNFSGFVFSGTGLLADSGTVAVSVKETGDTNTSAFGGGYFSVRPNFCLVPGRAYTFVLQAESAGEKALMSFRKVGAAPSQNLSCSFVSAGCSFKTYSLSGWAMDSKTGLLIQSGTVKVSVAETGDTYSAAFSNGYFSINPQFCLTPGKTYSFALSAEGGGKSGIVKYTRVGIG